MSVVHFFTFNLRLRDGRSIRTVSALLLQLVQTSAHGVRVQARRLSKARQHALAMRRQESMAETPLEKSLGPFLDEKDNEVLLPPMTNLAMHDFCPRKFSFTCLVLNLRQKLQRRLFYSSLRDLARPKRRKIRTRLSIGQFLTTLYLIFLLSFSGLSGPPQVFC